MIKGLAHITGGGIPGKLSGILPESVAAELNRGSWLVPPIFPVIQREGRVTDDEMYRVFNMGLGMVAVCDESAVAIILDTLPDAQVVGSIVSRGSQQQVQFI
jgi:phosphoribosylformylglycinamidine cyclo-ligase